MRTSSGQLVGRTTGAILMGLTLAGCPAGDDTETETSADPTIVSSLYGVPDPTDVGSTTGGPDESTSSDASTSSEATGGTTDDSGSASGSGSSGGSGAEASTGIGEPEYGVPTTG